jgi:hypothetical protein
VAAAAAGRAAAAPPPAAPASLHALLSSVLTLPLCMRRRAPPAGGLPLTPLPPMTPWPSAPDPSAGAWRHHSRRGWPEPAPSPPPARTAPLRASPCMHAAPPDAWPMRLPRARPRGPGTAAGACNETRAPRHGDSGGGRWGPVRAALRAALARRRLRAPDRLPGPLRLRMPAEWVGSGPRTPRVVMRSQTFEGAHLKCRGYPGCRRRPTC